MTSELLQHAGFPASYQRDNVTGDRGQLPFQCEMHTRGYFWSLSRISFSSKKQRSPGKDLLKIRSTNATKQFSSTPNSYGFMRFAEILGMSTASNKYLPKQSLTAALETF